MAKEIQKCSWTHTVRDYSGGTNGNLDLRMIFCCRVEALGVVGTENYFCGLRNVMYGFRH